MSTPILQSRASAPIGLKALLAFAIHILQTLIGLAVLLLTLWCALAIYYSNIPGVGLRAVVAGVFVLGTIAAFLFLRNRLITSIGFLICVAAVIIWWNLIPATNDGEFPPETAELAYAEFNGSTVTIHNVRDFDYRSETDYDIRRRVETFDVDKLVSVDFVVSHWDQLQDIAHTFLSFGFSDGRYVAASIEIRREKDEEYSTLKGLFKQFELIYIWGDERDLIRVRTDFRKEDVYVYPAYTTPEGRRDLFVSMLKRTNELREKPVFYNTLGQNCTTTIVEHVNEVVPNAIPWSNRLLMNGLSDLFAFNNGWIVTKKDFATTKALCLIDEAAQAAGNGPDFSAKIRAGRKLE